MPRYSFKAYDRGGSRAEGELFASSRDGALDVLARREQFPIELVERDAAEAPKWWQREVLGTRQLSLAALAMLTRELASLVAADLPIDECLRLVALQPMLPAKLRHTINNVLARVSEGEALSDAIAAQDKVFPQYYARMVRAGEASGSLGDCLNDLATFLERSADTRGKVVSTLLYPAVTIVAALAAMGVIMAVLIPAITPIFKEAGAAPPALISVLAGAEAALRANWPAVLLGLAAIAIGAAALLRNDNVRTMADRAVLRLPLIGGIVERRESGRLARTLATLIRTGVPIVEALRIGGSALTNRAMRSAVEAASEDIKEGGQLYPPLARSGLFSDLLLRLTAVGEQTGQLDTMLLRAAEIYDSALQRQLQRLTSLLTPAVTLLIGGLVGGLILTVMNALISVNDLALR